MFMSLAERQSLVSTKAATRDSLTVWLKTGVSECRWVPGFELRARECNSALRAHC